MGGQPRGNGGGRRRAGLCALALLLALALGVGATGLVRSGHAHKHAARVAAVLAVGSAETHAGTVDVDRSPAPMPPGGAAVGDATRDSSSSVSFRTAQTPQVRGPPGQSSA